MKPRTIKYLDNYSEIPDHLKNGFGDVIGSTVYRKDGKQVDIVIYRHHKGIQGLVYVKDEGDFGFILTGPSPTELDTLFVYEGHKLGCRVDFETTDLDFEIYLWVQDEVELSIFLPNPHIKHEEE